MTPRIFTDAGHGGDSLGTHDPGGGLVEKDVVLDIENQVHRSLEYAPVQMARSRIDDVTMTQSDRGERSVRFGGPFVASFHINDNPDRSCFGAQLYVYPGNKTTLRLANEFASPLSEVFGQCDVIVAHRPLDPDEPGTPEDERRRRLRAKWLDAPRSILLAHVCHVILFELGFRKNERDRRLLLDPLGREFIASALRLCLVRAAREYGD